jgi:hypothetical protein
MFLGQAIYVLGPLTLEGYFYINLGGTHASSRRGIERHLK